MKRMKLLQPFWIVVLLLLVTACGTDNGVSRKDRSAGGTSEILVVTQNDEQWDGMIGDTIRAFFLQAQYGLPQPEPINKLAHIKASGFNDMFKKHKCILLVEINSTLDKPVMETGEDLWAAPQRVMKIIAPDRASWCQTFNEHKEAIKVMFDKVERDRIMSVLRPSTDVTIGKRIKDKFGFTLTVPSGFSVAKEESDFLWIRSELEKCSYGIFIYTTPYVDTMQLEVNSLVAVRDRMTQKYVPGPSDGSYMSTETENVPPMVNYLSNFTTGFAAEMRGMWCVVGDYMGGPFVSYTFPDNNTGNLVTLEGYVYYPNQNKRDDLLKLQSILYSIKYDQE